MTKWPEHGAIRHVTERFYTVIPVQRVVFWSIPAAKWDSRLPGTVFLRNPTKAEKVVILEVILVRRQSLTVLGELVQNTALLAW